MADYLPFSPGISGQDIGLDTNIALPQTKVDLPSVDTESMFGGNLLKDMGGLEGLASLGSMIGGIMNARDEKKWRKRAEEREDRRVKREERRQKKFEDGMNAAWS